MGSATGGLVMHGLGGIGKTTLAAEIIARAGRLQPGLTTAVIRGEVSADEFLARLAEAVRRHPAAAAWHGTRAEALDAADRTSLPWASRLAKLRELVLGEVPVLVVLDDFDHNLSLASGRWTVRDPTLAALLAGWGDAPHLGRLLVACRRPFTVPGADRHAFGLRHLGPLSRSGAVALAKSLPALGRLDERDLDRVWRLLAGHPRTMEYLDALLSTGHERFDDVAARLAGVIAARTGPPAEGAGPPAPTDLSRADAETIACAAGDLLLGELWGRLSTGAQALLIGASVYRVPVACSALLLPAGRSSRAAELAVMVAECEAAGLLTVDPGRQPPSLFVHGWTTAELHRRLAEAGRDREVTGAHRRAAEYWRARVAAAPGDRQAQREAGYHLRQAGDTGRDQTAAGRTVTTLRRSARPVGLAVAVAAVTALLAAEATGVFSAPHPGSSASAAHRGGPGGLATPRNPSARARSQAAALSRAAIARNQAAAWVGREVRGSAQVACDRTMCSVLQAHGISAANLLVLGPSAPDPLGADVVMATVAVRTELGRRLASEYAPVIMASFGSGQLRVDIRAVANYGAAAYRAQLAADLAARRKAGRELLRNSRITFSPAARADLAAGLVDTRLLLILVLAAANGPLQVRAFGDVGPGAGSGVPMRAIEIAVPARAGGLRNLLTLVRAQRPPFLPAQADIAGHPGGPPVLDIKFAAPSPLGLLASQPKPTLTGTAQRR